MQRLEATVGGGQHRVQSSARARRIRFHFVLSYRDNGHCWCVQSAACIEVTPPRRTACVLKRALIDGILSDALLQANPRPTLVRSWPFVDEQPTGMLVNGDALFVAGGQDIMIFDIGSKAVGGSPLNTTLVASCGNACAAAMPGAG
eukprot:m.443313 g.443313  ORF g.443313 m.443313 type:complete len:146 (+) comp21483_c0_seq12:504-941(+)